jgi:hypothetical protein
MKIVRALLLIIGVLAVLMGLLWIGQGTGLVMWPASSFMLADRSWAVNGAILAAVGAFLIWLSRRGGKQVRR